MRLRLVRLTEAPIDTMKSKGYDPEIIDFAISIEPKTKFSIWVANQLRKDQTLISKKQDFIQIRDAVTGGVSVSGSDFNQALKKSEEWHKQFKAKDIELKGKNIVIKYPDGFTWVKLLNQDDCTEEGEAMGHCVAQYGGLVEAGNVNIYSLRDKNNTPHVTLELAADDTAVHQIQGKENKPPIEKYHEYIFDFLKKKQLDTVESIVEFGGPNIWKQYPSDFWHINGDLNLDGTETRALPDNLKITRSLRLSSSKITSLPDNLEVGEGLYLRDTPITSLPDNLKVGGSLDLKNTKITSLPDNLTVGGHLYLVDTEITSLPDNLTVGGDIRLNNTKITSLPDKLTVRGDFWLGNTPITSLPDHLKVNGELWLTNTPIKSLPYSLKVGKTLYLNYTPYLPDSEVEKVKAMGIKVIGR